jgi:hypothetical protein
MTSMQDAPRRRRVVVGVDTHKHIHVAVAVDELGGRIDTRSFAADHSGYEQMIDWASSLGREVIFGVEGTGSYGAGLASAIRRRSNGVLEVLRTDRRDRRLRGKSDTLDAENAARAVLNGQASAVPKSADGTAEMIRLVKVAKDVAVKARTSAMISQRGPGPRARRAAGAAAAADQDGVDLAVRGAATRPASRPDGRRETHPASHREKVAGPRHRDQDPMNRAGHRQANSALCRAVIVCLQYHQPTQAYYQRRTAEGRTKAEIIRCLKRLIALEIWSHLRPLRQARQASILAA